MNLTPSATPKIAMARRKNIVLAPKEMVRMEPLFSDYPGPLRVEPNVAGMNLSEWAGSQKAFVEELLLSHRAILFRNFSVKTAEDFQQAVKATSAGNFLEYVDRTTPRPAVGDKIYVSTVYPSQETIQLHNEGTYWTQWPLKIYFCCLHASEQGGETPIADTRKVCEKIPAAIRDEFARRKIMYVRNYGDGFGLPWQETFQTKDREVVEQYCREHDIQCEWKTGDRLRTRQVRPAIRKHPVTGESTWFNHGAFFHITSLEQTVRDALTKAFAEEDLPYNTYFGDGGAIDPAMIEEIRRAYAGEKRMFPWRNGDVLLLDNMSFAHARQPYVGERKVIVAMVEPQSGSEEKA